MNIMLSRILINCGFITEYLAQKVNITHNELKNEVKKNTLNVSKQLLFGKMTNIYILSDKQLNIYRKQGITIYKHNVNQLEHDYLLLKVYTSLSLKEQLSWYNETSLKAKFNKSTDTTDAIFIKNNKLIAVEVITPNYKHSKINNKKDFIRKYCDSSIILDTSNFKISRR